MLKVSYISIKLEKKDVIFEERVEGYRRNKQDSSGSSQ